MATSESSVNAWRHVAYIQTGVAGVTLPSALRTYSFRKGEARIDSGLTNNWSVSESLGPRFSAMPTQEYYEVKALN